LVFVAIAVRSHVSSIVGLFGVLLLLTSAFGADIGPSAPPPPLAAEIPPARAPAAVMFDRTSMYEARFGAFWHSPGFAEGRDFNADVNAELVFPKLPIPAPAWIAWFVPRPMIGVMANTAGKTSFAYVSAVWTWTWNNFFFEPIFGGAYHNGYTANAPAGRLELGCNPLFHTGISVGYYMTERWSIMGTWQHISNGGSCARNLGLNTYGLRLGYSFGSW
jgi:hypothetical protein